MKGYVARAYDLEDVNGEVLRSDLILYDLRLEVDRIDDILRATLLNHQSIFQFNKNNITYQYYYLNKRFL